MLGLTPTIIRNGDGDCIQKGDNVKIRYRAIDLTDNSLFDRTQFNDEIEQEKGKEKLIEKLEEDSNEIRAYNKQARQPNYIPNMDRDTLISIAEEISLNGYEIQSVATESTMINYTADDNDDIHDVHTTVPLPHGIHLALLKMCEGEISSVLIEPQLGFGLNGWNKCVPKSEKSASSSPSVKGNATLKYYIHVISVRAAEISDPFSSSNIDCLLEVKKQRLHANDYFAKGIYNAAYRKYLLCYQYLDQAFDLSDSDEDDFDDLISDNKKFNSSSISSSCTSMIKSTSTSTDDTMLKSNGELDVNYKIQETKTEIENEIFDQRIKLLNNMAITALKLKLYPKTISKCNSILRMSPMNIKALFNRSRAFLEFGDYHEAIKDCQNGLKIDTANKKFKRLRVSIKERARESRLKRNKMFQGIFRSDKDTSNDTTNKNIADWNTGKWIHKQD